MAPRVDERQVFESLQSLQQRRGVLDPDERRCLASEAVARGLENPPADGKFRPWVHRIYTNLVLDRLRRVRTQRDAPDLPSEPDITPEGHLLRAERVAALEQAMKALKPERRALLAMRFVENRDCDAIAVDLGVAPATVRTRVHRTLGELRRSLGNLGGFIPSFGQVVQLLPVASVLLVAALPVPAIRDAPSLAMAVSEAAPAKAFSGTPHPSPAEPVVPAAKVGSPRRPAKPARAVGENLAAIPAPAVSHFDFDDDSVTGDIQAPDDGIITAAEAAAHDSMIEIPSSFVPALVKSLEDL